MLQALQTHKTGSTTLGGVLFRVAASSNKSMLTTGYHYISTELPVPVSDPGGGGGSVQDTYVDVAEHA